MSIHPTAIVHDSARLADNVEVGPYSIIGADVEIGEGTKIEPHVVIKGPTHIGKHNHIFQFASVGESCQDLKYKGEVTYLEVGDYNIIRESCTLHRGTLLDQGITRIGSHNLFMVNVHIAHDCIVKDHTVFANNVAIGGHVHVGNHAILGGLTAVHQFCHLGDHCITGGGSVVLKDIPAYVMASGNPIKPFGINAEGLNRRRFSKQVVNHLRNAYKVVYRQGNRLETALETLDVMAKGCEEIGGFAASIRSSSRGIIR